MIRIAANRIPLFYASVCVSSLILIVVEHLTLRADASISMGLEHIRAMTLAVVNGENASAYAPTSTHAQRACREAMAIILEEVALSILALMSLVVGFLDVGKWKGKKRALAVGLIGISFFNTFYWREFSLWRGTVCRVAALISGGHSVARMAESADREGEARFKVDGVSFVRIGAHRFCSAAPPAYVGPFASQVLYITIIRSETGAMQVFDLLEDYSRCVVVHYERQGTCTQPPRDLAAQAVPVGAHVARWYELDHEPWLIIEFSR